MVTSTTQQFQPDTVSNRRRPETGTDNYNRNFDNRNRNFDNNFGDDDNFNNRYGLDSGNRNFDNVDNRNFDDTRFGVNRDFNDPNAVNRNFDDFNRNLDNNNRNFGGVDNRRNFSTFDNGDFNKNSFNTLDGLNKNNDNDFYNSDSNRRTSTNRPWIQQPTRGFGFNNDFGRGRGGPSLIDNNLIINEA